MSFYLEMSFRNFTFCCKQRSLQVLTHDFKIRIRRTSVANYFGREEINWESMFIFIIVGKCFIENKRQFHSCCQVWICK